MEPVLAFSANPTKKRKKSKSKKRKHYGKNPGNPKKKGKRKKSKPSFFKKIFSKDTVTEVAGVTGGLLVADLGVRKLSDWIGKEKPLVQPASAMDAAASFVTGTGAAYLAKRLTKSDVLALATYHSGMTVAVQKVLASGRDEPLGDKIAAGYGSRLRSMFAGVGQDEDDILLIPTIEDTDGVGISPEEGASVTPPFDGMGQEEPEFPYD